MTSPEGDARPSTPVPVREQGGRAQSRLPRARPATQRHAELARRRRRRDVGIVAGAVLVVVAIVAVVVVVDVTRGKAGNDLATSVVSPSLY